ncbi:hypothetical protein BGX29_003983 [Mortierella sp. GBA35]|nr:hypothetical protein BGX23_005080 [Mortierella sp. AD031]KAF9082240.1 hypothetical protein BGX29_003983 [Mortierella sp. GBA35]KAG0195946.1 hypothetical protein BGX33_002303 [Mortierella sp. NVP41]
MRLALFALSFLALSLIRSEAATNVVRIDPNSGLVCLILPPPGKLIGDTEQDGHVQCTDGKPKLLPSQFFVIKNFQVTKDYVQAWGFMNGASVGLLPNDGGGQYDTHKDSGDNVAPGYAVFVELLEPDSGRWCIRFCHKIGHQCNMGKSTFGCEGALGIKDWPTH